MRRLLRLARAGRLVQRSDSPFAHLELNTFLESTDPGLPPYAMSHFGSLVRAARICVRQRLVATATYQYLLPELMCAVANPKVPVSVTAPAAWREALRSRGIQVASSSILRWWVLIALFYAQGLRVAVLRVWEVLTGRMPCAPRDEYAVLMFLTPNMTPRGEMPGFDFVSWYLHSIVRDPRIPQTWAHVPGSSVHACAIPSVTITPQYLPRLNGYWRKLRFLCGLLWQVAGSTVRGLSGQWWEIVLLEQLVDVVYARLLSAQDFARAYVFNNGWWAVRPLWTYVAEEAGATIDLVFYGTNIETFGVTRAQPRPVWPGYKGMTWQRYVVWDEVHADFLHELGLTAPVIIAGPVGFADSAAIPEQSPKPYVVVFDVTPHRPVSLATRGVPQPYYTPELWWQFINEIQASLAASGFSMVYKKKREIGRLAAAGFRASLERLREQKRLFAVEPDTAPQRLMLEAAGVISMPFTSTALIARAMGKPTVYYDPLGVLVEEHGLAHGIDVIGKRTDLMQWLATLRPGDDAPVIEHIAGLPIKL